MLLTRDQILSAQDLQSQDVPVPEWGGTVRIRMMSGLARDAFTESLVGTDGKVDGKAYRLKLIAACVIGEDGAPVFRVADVEALGAKSAVALDRVFDACDKLNAPTAQAVDAAEKN
jgi:hypothetical protein